MGTEQVVPSHPRPHGPMVKFYLGKSIRGVAIPGNGQMVQSMNINGYTEKLTFVAVNELPREYYEVLMNSQSRSIVPDLEKAIKVPHNTGGIMGSGYLKEEVLCDYEVQLIKEDK